MNRFGDTVKNKIEAVASAVRALHENEGTGHDWQHIQRVRKTGMKLATEEYADLVITELALLLHDTDDRKITGDIETETTLPTARRIITEAGFASDIIETVLHTIRSTGFHKALAGPVERSLEAQILSDADQLDAIGAIGIARTFVYGSAKSRPMFLPDEVPMESFTKEQYHNNQGSTVAHFFEKLLKLRTMMHTSAGQREAEKRHLLMVDYLGAFFDEADAPAEWQQRLDKYRTIVAETVDAPVFVRMIR